MAKMLKREKQSNRNFVQGKTEEFWSSPVSTEVTEVTEVLLPQSKQRKIGMPSPANTPVSDKVLAVDSEQSNIIQLKEGTRRAGVSKGVTINLQNYESARVTYWMERVINDSDEDYKREIIKMSELIEGIIESDIAEF